ncbi:MAG TPA: imelysin family protein [Oligoflexus sp.]|uniref:imelysin family protein n=1 Tax=Oligoflexus sp. TaxID=1971216 RepID=UPI002D62F9A8|nr:imelysin family protein [Oligoflexus sp.]HYX34177.1 imelysin family protein [Oligoflexus sp.]
MRFKLFLGLTLVTGMNLGCDSNSSSKSTDGVPVQTPPPDDGIPPPETPSNQVGGLVGGLRLTQAHLFRNLGDGIAQNIATFAQSTTQLGQAIEVFCVEPTTQDKAPVRAAWKETMLLWEELEVQQVGPIAANEKALKTAIYGWPVLANTCRIDEETLKAIQSPTYTLPPNSNRKGLQAIEHLLYEETLASSCPGASASKKEWDALPLATRAQARCLYLKPLALELQAMAASVSQAWGTQGSNYLTGVIGNPEAEKTALQSLYENLFYLDIEVKNYKLASPAGHDPKFCPNSPAPCPGKDEFPLSQISREAIQANITGFTDLIYGFEEANQVRPGGFAALVREVGDDAVATRSETLTRELAGYFAAQNESLANLIVQQNQENCDQSQISLLCQLRKSIKQISSDFKYEYSRLLSLTVPAGPQGDND